MFIRSDKDGTNHTTGYSSQFSFASLIARLFHTSVTSGLTSIIVLWSMLTLKKITQQTNIVNYILLPFFCSTLLVPLC